MGRFGAALVGVEVGEGRGMVLWRVLNLLDYHQS
jgi:hypothetical protein